MGGKNIKCPIGVIDDIEIIFLHYQTPEEAKMKWNRRKKRIHWDKLYLKMSESNMCNLEHLKAFDKLLYNNKFMFVSKDYGLNNQIVCSEWSSVGEVIDDTTHFRRYIDLVKWINGDKYQK